MPQKTSSFITTLEANLSIPQLFLEQQHFDQILFPPL